MLVISRRKSLRLIGRAFHISQIHEDNNNSLRVISQKAYANLPATKRLSDDSNITPLQDWDGGLEFKRNRRHIVICSIIMTITAVQGAKTTLHDYGMHHHYCSFRIFDQALLALAQENKYPVSDKISKIPQRQSKVRRSPSEKKGNTSDGMSYQKRL